MSFLISIYRYYQVHQVWISTHFGKSDLYWLLRWLITISIATANKIHLIGEQMFGFRPEEAVFNYLFCAIENGVLRELCTKQFCQVIRLALGLSRSSDIIQRAKDMFQHGFVKHKCSFFSSTLVPTFNWWSSHLRLVFHHAICLPDKHKKNMKAKPFYKNRMRVSPMIQKDPTAWKAFVDFAFLGLRGSFTKPI